ncbi:unnamed protein product [Cuscuta epithymum]|uniref:Uncharacterized protein n=1 Tax=Cuscuta epithymum TaxID=186058 RepID=A0AAV0CNV0_9ASTE|nr:unnamed protein product [Cuscuta epithymum]
MRNYVCSLHGGDNEPSKHVFTCLHESFKAKDNKGFMFVITYIVNLMFLHLE